MTRTGWWLARTLSRWLKPAERDAVLGDLAECGAGDRAVLEIAGLIARRTTEPWRESRAWVAALGVAIPVALALSLSSFALGGRFDLFLWVARNHETLDPTTLDDIGLTLWPGIARLLVSSLFLGCWAWTCGFVLGSVARGAAGLNAWLACLVVAAVALFGLNFRGRYPYAVDEGLFSLAFYTVVFPLILQVGLVLAPMLLGVREALRNHSRVALKGLVWIIAAATILVLRNWLYWPFRFRSDWMWMYLAYWPFLFVAVSTAPSLWNLEERKHDSIESN